MDTTCFPDWDNEFEAEFNQRTQMGGDNDLVELLWQNGEIVLHNQTSRKQSYDPIKSKPVLKDDQSKIESSTNLVQDEETISWFHCPDNESFDAEFCSNFLYEIPLTNPVEVNKLPKISASEVDFASVSVTSPRCETFEPVLQHEPKGDDRKASNLDLPVNRQEFSQLRESEISEFSVVTFGSSNCGSNQVASSCGVLSRTLSAGVDVNHAKKVSPRSNECTERETFEQDFTSSSGGSRSSFLKTSNQSNANNFHKRKRWDVEQPECESDATELESASGSKSQKSGTTRRSRVAEVHNLSERKRRDRINEKMRALQELIPHSNKSDKASMLDDVIEYMKSLQSQIQLMWMGRGIAPMMLTGMQHYMSQLGTGIGSVTLPPIHNLMPMERFPQVYQAMTVAPTSNQTSIGLIPVLNPVNYQNQMQSAGFCQQYANFMSPYSMQNTSQSMNMFSFGSNSSQLNHHVLASPGNGNGSIA